MPSYKDLEIFQKSLDMFYRAHAYSLTLPKYEMYELGSQLRRAADSVNSNIVEGYGRREYKQEFIRFLVFSHASCLEVQIHLKKLSKLYPNLSTNTLELINEYDQLGAQIFKYLQYVRKSWKS